MESNNILAAASELHLNRSDSGKTNTDISECSTTNTEDYVSCTDNSRRTTPGTKLPSASSSSTTQVPGSKYTECVLMFRNGLSMFYVLQTFLIKCQNYR